MLTGTLVNTGTVIIGSLLGMLLGNILPERLRDTVMKGLGLCTVLLGSILQGNLLGLRLSIFCHLGCLVKLYRCFIG